jgi:hypothetical protein
MSQPRRRRRRRRGGQQGAGRPAQQDAKTQGGASSAQAQQPARASQTAQPQPGRRSRRRRRGRGGQGSPAERPSPKSSEDLVRAAPREQPESLTGPPDGRTLEGVIGELQSIWGVPQNPQEYRITMKVAEERESRGQRVAALEEVREERPADVGDGRLRREKAPAAPRIAPGPTDAATEEAPARRKRSRRRRRRGGRASS